MTCLSLSPLSPEAFAPYGVVIAHAGPERRHYLSLDLDCSDDPCLRIDSWVSRIDLPLSDTPVLTRMEHHPHSDQAFVPLSGQRYLVVVCDSDAAGLPDPATLKGFVAAPGQGVVYHRLVWHSGMQVFDAPAEFFVQMKRHISGGDDVFAALPQPIRIRIPEEVAA